MKIDTKQNFVRRKIAVWAFVIYFEVKYIFIRIKTIYTQKRVLFFFYKKVCVKRECRGMAFDTSA